MSAVTSLEISELSVAAARRIDAACDRLEEALQKGRPWSWPEMKDLVEAGEQPALLCQLLLVEWEYRHERGDAWELTEYLARFPEHATLIQHASHEHTLEMRPSHANTPQGLDTISHSEWEQRGYQIVCELGRGGMGTVYLACQMAADRLVALKVLHASTESDAAALARFRQEARALARLQHPNIVPVFEVGEHLGRPFFSMEYCPGGSLADLFHQQRLPPRAAADLVETLAHAAHAAHSSGIVHRDLKPSNVLLIKDEGGRMDRKDEGRRMKDEPEGSSERSSDSSFILHPSSFLPKLADFGLAKTLDTSGQTHSGTVLGTPQYMAPEQARGESRDVGVTADVYALGAILYECLAGRPPFLGPTLLDTVVQVISSDVTPPSRLRPATPRDLETICLKCLEKDPRTRYTDAAALAEDLRRFRAGEPILARSPSSPERAWKWSRRHPAAATLVGVLILGSVAAFGLAAWAWGERQEALRTTAQLSFERALAFGEQNDSAGCMLWLARSLEIAIAAGDRELEQCIRIQLAAWHRDTQPLRRMFVGHQSNLFAVAFSPDGRRMLTGSSDHTARLWNAATGQQIGEPLQHGGTVYAVAFSPDGTSVLTGCGDNTAQMWDAVTGQRRGAPFHHEHRVLAVAYSPCGQTVLTGSHDTTAQLWDASSDTLVLRLEHPDIVRCVAFSPDGKTILTGCDDGAARQWAVDTGQLQGPTVKHTNRVFAVAFSPDGRSIATGSRDFTAQIWDAATGQRQGGPLKHGDTVFAVGFSPDGKTLLTSGDDPATRLWDATTGIALCPPLAHPAQVRAAVFGPDGKTVITGCWDDVARLWDVPSPMLLRHASAVCGVTFSPDGESIVTVSEDNTAQLWKTASGRPLGPRLQHREVVQRAAFSPDGTWFVTGSDDHTARLWHTATGQPRGQPLKHDGAVWTVAISPDGQTMLTGGFESNARLWNSSTGQLLRTLEHQDSIQDVAFSPDGKTLLTASGGKDKTARLWNAATGEAFGLPLQHTGGVAAVEFSPDGRSVLTGSWDTTARLWDSSTGKPLTAPLEHQRLINAAIFSPDGKTVLTGSEDHTARLWDATTGRPLCPPLLHQGVVCAIAFSSDGQTVITASEDRTACLWDAATGKRIGAPLQHPDRCSAAALSRDGFLAATGSRDGITRVWRLPPPVADDPLHVMLRTQAITGLSLDERGVARPLDVATRSKLAATLQPLRDARTR